MCDIYYQPNKMASSKARTHTSTLPNKRFSKAHKRTGFGKAAFSTKVSVSRYIMGLEVQFNYLTCTFNKLDQHYQYLLRSNSYKQILILLAKWKRTNIEESVFELKIRSMLCMLTMEHNITCHPEESRFSEQVEIDFLFDFILNVILFDLI